MQAKRDALALLLSTDFVKFITGEEQAKFRALIKKCDPKLIYPDEIEKKEKKEKDKQAAGKKDKEPPTPVKEVKAPAAKKVKEAPAPAPVPAPVTQSVIEKKCTRCQTTQPQKHNYCYLCGEKLP